MILFRRPGSFAGRHKCGRNLEPNSDTELIAERLHCVTALWTASGHYYRDSRTLELFPIAQVQNEAYKQSRIPYRLKATGELLQVLKQSKHAGWKMGHTCEYLDQLAMSIRVGAL